MCWQRGSPAASVQSCADGEVKDFKSGGRNPCVVTVAAHQWNPTGACRRGDPEVVVADVPTAADAEVLQASPLVDGGEVEWDAEERREPTLLAIDSRLAPPGLQIAEARLRQRDDADREGRAIDATD